MKVHINREGCVSCGLCVSLCPEVFNFADDGLAEVVSNPQPDNYSAVSEAADGCPVSVISTEE